MEESLQNSDKEPGFLDRIPLTESVESFSDDSVPEEESEVVEETVNSPKNNCELLETSFSQPRKHSFAKTGVAVLLVVLTYFYLKKK